MTVLPEAATPVKTLLLCSMSKISAPVVSTVAPELVPAVAPVKVTAPKFANATRLFPCWKSSTIHSAFWPPRTALEVGGVKLLDTLLPVVLFVMVTTPAFEEVDLTRREMVSPALMTMLLVEK